jgi:heat shock protein 1/8
MAKYCASEFLLKKFVDITDHPKAMMKLRVNCEKAKKILSTNMQANIDVDNLGEGEDYSTVINRELFERLCKSYFDKIVPLI